MLVDGFNDLHGFRASVPDDGEFDGVMSFAVPVLHVSVKECGAALLSLLAQFRQFNVEEMNVGQRPWFAVGSSEMVVPCVRVGSLDRFGEHGDVTRGASDVGEDEALPAFVDVDSELGRHGWLVSCRRCCGKHGVYFVIRDWRRRPFRWCFLPGRFVNEANKFFDDERARSTDDCQYCANRHDPVRVTHVDVLKPIRNSIHDVQSTTGGVSCRI